MSEQKKQPAVKAFGRITIDKPETQKSNNQDQKQGRNKKTVERKKNEIKRNTAMQKNVQNKKPVKKEQPTLKTEKKQQPIRKKNQQADKRNVLKNRDANIRIVPLGGIGEIGKNMTVVEVDKESIIVDCGMSFPDIELYGVDIVIPEFTFVENLEHKPKAIFITHGHEDHIGAIPYFLRKLNIPIYGGKLAIGLIKAKLKEHKMLDVAKLYELEPGEIIEFKKFSIEGINVNHSIPDAMSYAINTPSGHIIFTGDFKIDYTPVFGDVINLPRFSQLGQEGVLALLADSTSAERPGTSLSERVVGESFERLFGRAEGKRLIIATFASNIQRIQQIITLAQSHGRKIAFSGRSMENYTEIAIELGYLMVNDGVIVSIDSISKYRPQDLIIITTGSQGESLSALSRMSAGNHRQVTICEEDVIIISANPIPGNEKMVSKVINQLMRKGSDVIYESMYDVHASGHACKEELKLMIKLTKPKYVIPVHGEYKHLIKHGEIAKSLGYQSKDIILAEIGRVIEFSKNKARLGDTVPSGRILVDGLGVGDVGSVVLRDRKHLAEDGLIVVVCSIDVGTKELLSGPDIISRGFVYVKESENLIDETKACARAVVERCLETDELDYGEIKVALRNALSTLLNKKTKRNPMILPIIMDI